MSAEIQLSYILTTRNKLPFLKETLIFLLNSCQPDEEIVIVDGASTDGTVEYLTQLYKQGSIHQFLTEPDHGEAHGINRGLLLARGQLIKIITDDDAFYWPGIQSCKAFMLDHAEIDVLGTEGAGAQWGAGNPYSASLYSAEYEKWLAQSKPFSFCGLGLMIRRSSLPVLGLFHTGFLRVDHEYSLRVTAGPANLAWFTGYTWVRMINSQSNSVKYAQRIRAEGRIVDLVYSPDKKTSLPPYGKFLTVGAARVNKFLRRALRRVLSAKSIQSPTLEKAPWDVKMQLSNKWLQEQNIHAPGEFLYRR